MFHSPLSEITYNRHNLFTYVQTLLKYFIYKKKNISITQYFNNIVY